MKIKFFLTRHLEEISRDRRLPIFGAALFGLHAASAYLWRFTLPRDLEELYPVCGPYFSGCASVHGLPILFYQIALGAYAGLAILGAIFFLRGFIRHGVALLTALSLVQFLFALSDYRLGGSAHVFFLALSLCFLGVDRKVSSSQLFVVFYLFMMGFGQLHHEWLARPSLSHPSSGWLPPILDKSFTPWMLTGLVFSELWIVWGLLKKNGGSRWACWATLTLLQLFWWYRFDSSFFTLVSIVSLSIFPLTWAMRPSTNAEVQRDQAGGESAEGVSLIFWRRARWTELVFFSIFFLSQLLPFFRGAVSLPEPNWSFMSPGGARPKSVCAASLIIKYRDRSVEYIPRGRIDAGLACDPVFILAEARNICREQAAWQEFVDVDVFLSAKSETEREYTTVLSEINHCSKSGLSKKPIASAER